MYLEHFELSDRPFRLTPDLAYEVEAHSRNEALTTLSVALEQGEGFIKVTGEVGLGKTLLCRRLLESLGSPFVTAWLPDPHLSAGTLRTALARELEVDLPARPTQREVHERLQHELTRRVAAGQKPVLIIDEAQALPTSALETIRLLTNLETERRKLLQVVLFAQPELDQRLARPELRQLRQRITYSCHLEPLARDHVGRYLAQRLARAGCRRSLFTPAAVRRIARASGGVPRLVNILADKALLSAYGRGRDQADWIDAGRAMRDTESVQNRMGWPSLQPAARAAAFGLVALGVYFALELTLGRST